MEPQHIHNNFKYPVHSSLKLSEYFKFLSLYNQSADSDSLDNSESGRHVKILEKLVPVSKFIKTQT